jgi:hypothetical protein
MEETCPVCGVRVRTQSRHINICLAKKEKAAVEELRADIATKARRTDALTAVDELRADPRGAALAALVATASSTVVNTELRSGVPSSGSVAVSNRMYDLVVPQAEVPFESLTDDCDIGGDASACFWEDDPVDASIVSDIRTSYPMIPASLHLDRKMARLLLTKSGRYMDNLLPMLIFGGADKSDQLPVPASSASGEVLDDALPANAGSASGEAAVKPSELDMAHCRDMTRLQKWHVDNKGWAPCHCRGDPPAPGQVCVNMM